MFINLLKREFMKFVQQIEVHMYQEESGNMPVRDWLHKLSKDDRQIIG
jgi:hypothetical protein